MNRYKFELPATILVYQRVVVEAASEEEAWKLLKSGDYDVLDHDEAEESKPIYSDADLYDVEVQS